MMRIPHPKLDLILSPEPDDPFDDWDDAIQRLMCSEAPEDVHTSPDRQAAEEFAGSIGIIEDIATRGVEAVYGREPAFGPLC